MKQAVKTAIQAKGLPNFGPRRPHKNCSHNLCTCGETKKRHFSNFFGHPFKAGDQKNNLALSDKEFEAQQKKVKV